MKIELGNVEAVQQGVDEELLFLTVPDAAGALVVWICVDFASV